jgi:hypothetical protein
MECFCSKLVPVVFRVWGFLCCVTPYDWLVFDAKNAAGCQDIIQQRRSLDAGCNKNEKNYIFLWTWSSWVTRLAGTDLHSFSWVTDSANNVPEHLARKEMCGGASGIRAEFGKDAIGVWHWEPVGVADIFVMCGCLSAKRLNFSVADKRTFYSQAELLKRERVRFRRMKRENSSCCSDSSSITEKVRHRSIWKSLDASRD